MCVGRITFKILRIKPFLYRYLVQPVEVKNFFSLLNAMTHLSRGVLTPICVKSQWHTVSKTK